MPKKDNELPQASNLSGNKLLAIVDPNTGQRKKASIQTLFNQMGASVGTGSLGNYVQGITQIPVNITPGKFFFVPAGTYPEFGNFNKADNNNIVPTGKTWQLSYNTDGTWTGIEVPYDTDVLKLANIGVDVASQNSIENINSFLYGNTISSGDNGQNSTNIFGGGGYTFIKDYAMPADCILTAKQYIDSTNIQSYNTFYVFSRSDNNLFVLKKTIVVNTTSNGEVNDFLIGEVSKGDYLGFRPENLKYKYQEGGGPNLYIGYAPTTSETFQTWGGELGIELSMEIPSLNTSVKKATTKANGVANKGLLIRPTRAYTFENYLPFDIVDIGGVNPTISKAGLSIISNDTGYSKYLKFPSWLDCREYTITAEFTLQDVNTRIAAGAGGGYPTDALWNFGIIKNPVIINQQANTMDSGSDMDSSVGDLCRISLTHYYDRFSAKFENLTKGTSQTLAYTIDVTGSGNVLFQPLNAKPRFMVQQGSILLTNFKVEYLNGNKWVKTLVIGDSISSCFYAGAYSSAWQFKTFTENNFATISGPGYTTQDAINHLEQGAMFGAKYALIYLGTNDLLQGKDVETFFKANMRTIINYYLSIGTTPVLMTLGLITNGIDNSAYNVAIKALGAEYDIKVIDISAVNTASNMFSDGVHPNQSGHLNIANKIKSVAPEII